MKRLAKMTINSSNTSSLSISKGMILSILIMCSIAALSQNSFKKRIMKTPDFTTTLLVDQSPAEAYKAINNPRAWWSEEIAGSTDKLNSEFKYHYQDVHRSQMKVIDLVPNQKVVWLVEDNFFKFTKDKTEWKGTKIVFDISKAGNKTQIRFTHLGLVPQYECFKVCSDAWTTYIQNSLGSLITTGKGQPNATGKPQTESEKKMGKNNL